jgi:hypothetical protein
MNSRKQPVSILILSCLYIAVGSLGFVYHFREVPFHAGAVISFL